MAETDIVETVAQLEALARCEHSDLSVAEDGARIIANLLGDLDEQCRLLGKGGEREAKLASDNQRLRDEVERLRAGGCARDQGLTQFCAEAAKFAREAAAYRHIREAANGMRLLMDADKRVLGWIEAAGDRVEIDIRNTAASTRSQRAVSWLDVEHSVLNPILMHMDDMLAAMGVELPDGWSWIDGAPLPPAPHKGE